MAKKLWMRFEDPAAAFRAADRLSADYGRGRFAVLEDHDPARGGDAYPYEVVSSDALDRDLDARYGPRKADLR